MIPGRRRQHRITSDQLQAFAFESGRDIEVEEKAGVMVVKLNRGFEFVAPLSVEAVA